MNEIQLDTNSTRICSCQTIEYERFPKHLEKLYEDSCVNLDSDQKEKVKQMLLINQKVFSRHSNDIGRTSLVTHKIDTQGATPIK